jgi:peptide/nickel transport system substrate-binding protein
VREVEQLLNSGLLLMDNEGHLRPLLAEQAPTIENGLWKVLPDGRMETTWTLKPNLRWHSGAPVTTADMVLAGKIAMDKTLTIAQDLHYDAVDSIEAVDDRTLRVSWKKPFIEADTLFSYTERSRIMPMPSHVLAEVYEQDRANVLQHASLGQEYVGTGPFRLKEWVVGSHMVVQANDAFVLGRPKLDEFEVRFLWDTNVIVANVLSGAVEMTLGAGLTVEQAMMTKEQWRSGRVETPLETMTGLWPQHLTPDPVIIGDVRFRRALLHALDRQQIVDTFLFGLVPVADSFIPPDHTDFRAIDPVVAKYPYDTRRAIQLIDEFGYAKDPDGSYRDPSGKKLTVEVRTTAHDLREKLIHVLADYWQKVGVANEAVIIPRQRAQDREYRATTLGFDFRFNPPDVTRYHSTQIPLPDNNFRGNNSARYRNAELDALLDKYVVTIPRQERTQVLAQVIKHMTEQLVVVPLFHDAEPMFVGSRVLNITARRGDAYPGWNAHEWDVKTS